MSAKPLVQFHMLKAISYGEVWDFQKTLQQKLIQNKHKSTGKVSVKTPNQQIGHLIFTEHNPVYTLGKSGSVDHLLLSTTELKDKNIEYHKINRGEDITFHGPGQITGYLILDLDDYYHDVHKFVRDIEAAIIHFLKKYDIVGDRINEYTGVWIKDSAMNRKICAIGVHMSRWVSLHGFALNIHTDLSYFKGIVPCGINEADKEVTNLELETGRSLSIDSVTEELKDSFATIFNFQFVN